MTNLSIKQQTPNQDSQQKPTAWEIPQVVKSNLVAFSGY